jgi:hypothetical protein
MSEGDLKIILVALDLMSYESLHYELDDNGQQGVVRRRSSVSGAAQRANASNIEATKADNKMMHDATQEMISKTTTERHDLANISC